MPVAVTLPAVMTAPATLAACDAIAGNGPWITVWIGVLVVCAGLFGVLTINVVRDAYFDWDIAFMSAMQANRPAWLDTLAHAVAWVGFPPQSNLIIGGLVLLLVVLGLRWEALCTAIAATVTAVVWFQITPLINRPRPSDDLVPVGSSIPLGSFPSGHVLTYVGVYGFMAVVAHGVIANPQVRWPVSVGLVGLVGLVGPSRIYLGHHWPTDVAASYTQGLAYLVALLAIYQRVKSREL